MQIHPSLPKLKKIVGNLDWWDGISWEHDNVKSKLSHLYKELEDGGEVEELEGGGEDDHQE